MKLSSRMVLIFAVISCMMLVIAPQILPKARKKEDKWSKVKTFRTVK